MFVSFYKSRLNLIHILLYDCQRFPIIWGEILFPSTSYHREPTVYTVMQRLKMAEETRIM
jgi:hypothetical protein